MSTAVQEGRFETTTPLMKTAQVQEANEEKSRLEETLNAPPHIGSQIQNRGDMIKQLRSISHQLDTQMPHAYDSDQRDAAVAREKELREKWLAGMPTTAEMGRKPAGAVDKHMRWEMNNKTDIMEWKNIRRRLAAGGEIDGGPLGLDVANVEVYRPTSASHELSLENAQITRPDYHFGGPVGPKTVLTESDLKLLEEVAPEIRMKVALLDEEARAQIKDIIEAARAAPPEEPAHAPKKGAKAK